MYIHGKDILIISMLQKFKHRLEKFWLSLSITHLRILIMMSPSS